MAAGVAKPLICLNHSHRHVLGTLSSFKASLKYIHGNHTPHVSEIYTSRFTRCGIIFYVDGVTLTVTSIRPGLSTFCTVLCMKTSDRFNGIQHGICYISSVLT